MTSTIQFILAFLMLYHALPKILFSKNKLKTIGGKEMEYVDDLSQNNLKLILNNHSEFLIFIERKFITSLILFLLLYTFLPLYLYQ